MSEKEHIDEQGSEGVKLPSIASHRSLKESPSSKFMKPDMSPAGKIVEASSEGKEIESNNMGQVQMVDNPGNKNSTSNKVNPHPGGNLSVDSNVHANFHEDKALLGKDDK